jgi:hypothetical protein
MFGLLNRIRADLIVLALVAAGLLLNIYAPLWLTPPLFEYTVWFYLLLFFAWIPVYVLLLRRRRRASLLLLTILVGGLLMTCACMTIRPRSAFGVVFLDSVECVQQELAGGWMGYTCIRQSFDGPEFNRTFYFESLPGLPIMWRVGGDF